MTDLDSLLSALDTIETFDPNTFPVTVLKDATTTAVRALSESNEDELFARFGRAVIIRMAQHSEPNKALGWTKPTPGNKPPKMPHQFQAIFYGAYFERERRKWRKPRMKGATLQSTANDFGVGEGTVRNRLQLLAKVTDYPTDWVKGVEAFFKDTGDNELDEFVEGPRKD